MGKDKPGIKSVVLRPEQMGQILHELHLLLIATGKAGKDIAMMIEAGRLEDAKLLAEGMEEGLPNFFMKILDRCTTPMEIPPEVEAKVRAMGSPPIPDYDPNCDCDDCRAAREKEKRRVWN